MTEAIPTAKNYREYALRLRQVAKGMEGPGNKATLRSFADDYEYLATSIEKTTAARKIQLSHH